MKSSARKIELASVDDLFTTEESRQDAALERIQIIPLTELHPFPDHPFSVRDDDDIMKETLDSELEKVGYIVRRQLRGENGKLGSVEYTIYERPQTPDTPRTDLPCTGFPDTVEPDTGAPDTENPAQLNTKRSITKKSNTQRSNTHSFPPPAPSAPPAPPAAPVEGMKEILEKRAEIEDQIEFDLIADLTNREQLRV